MLVAVLALAVQGCGSPRHGADQTEPVRLSLGTIAPTFAASLVAQTAPALRLVFADTRSRTLVVADYPLELASGQPSAKDVRPVVLDRIAEGTDPGYDLGTLAYTVLDGLEYLAYLDQAADGKATLKLLRRAADEQTWDVDLVQPVGRPLAYLRSGPETWLLVETRDGIVAAGATPGVRGRTYEVGPGLRPRGSLSVVPAPEGDTAVLIDDITTSLILMRLAGDEPWRRVIPAPEGSFGPVSHARADPVEGICLFYYDPRSQDLKDLRRLGDEAPRLVKVTRAREVTAVCSVPVGDHTLFLYAELAPDRSGRLQPSLTMLSAPAGGKAEARHLGTSATQYRSLGVVPTPESLLVLALADELYLYHVSI